MSYETKCLMGHFVSESLLMWRNRMGNLFTVGVFSEGAETCTFQRGWKGNK